MFATFQVLLYLSANRYARAKGCLTPSEQYKFMGGHLGSVDFQVRAFLEA